MKWTMTETYWKITVALGAMTSFLLAAGAAGKWG
jgi:hypothetical protein